MCLLVLYIFVSRVLHVSNQSNISRIEQKDLFSGKIGCLEISSPYLFYWLFRSLDNYHLFSILISSKCINEFTGLPYPSRPSTIGMYQHCKVVLGFLLIVGCSCDNYYGNEFGSGVDEYPTDFITELYPGPHESGFDALTKCCKKLINVWFGSSEEADRKLWNRIEDGSQYADQHCHFDKAWVYEETRIILTNKENNLSEADRNKVMDGLDTVIREEVDFEVKHKPKCSQIFWALRKHRSDLDCLLGPHMVCDRFKNITSHYQLGMTQCYVMSQELWADIIHATGNQRCSMLGAYKDLLFVAQISRNGFLFSESSKAGIEIQLRANMTEIMSSPSHLTYMNRITCPNQAPTLECPKIVEQITNVICEDRLSFTMVEGIMKLLDMGSKLYPPTTPEDMAVLMDMQMQLTKLTKAISTTNLQRSPSENPDITMNMLKFYLSIVDNTVASNTEKLWHETPKEIADKRLCDVLVHTEEYTNAMSDLIFRNMKDVNSTMVDKDSMSLYMAKYSPHQPTGKMGFQFEEAEIETVLTDSAADEELKVFSFHYKYWAMLQAAPNSTSGGSQGYPLKSIVGKGGIISLSARLNDTKRSVPVSYKMKFGDQLKTEKKGDTAQYHRCLSCEYLNTVTGKWETDGCSVRAVDEKGVSCHCNHTTNFAAFMSPVPINMTMTDAQYYAKQVVSYIGSSLSVIALAVSLVIFNMVRPTVRNDRLKAHMNLAVALFFVHATQLTVDFAIYNDISCLTTAIITHFFLLAAFFWMLIEGIFLYIYVVQVFVHSSTEYIRLVFILGWAIPLLIVCISAGVGIPNEVYLEVKEVPSYCEEGQMIYPPLPFTGSKYKSCWLSTKSGMAWSFLAPALLIIAINCVILVKVVQVLLKVSGKSQAMQPYRPPTSSAASYGKNAKNNDNSVFENNPLPSINQSQFKMDNGKVSTANGSAEKYQTSGNSVMDSPNRLDSRTTSQAYLYNRTQGPKQPNNQSPVTSKSHFANDVKSAVKGSLVLLPILGIPWICGLWVGNNFALMMIFLLINSTQGVVIFIVYCLMNGEVRRAMRRQLQVRQIRSRSGRSRTSSTSSLRSLNTKMFQWRRKTSATVSQIPNK